MEQTSGTGISGRVDFRARLANTFLHRKLLVVRGLLMQTSRRRTIRWGVCGLPLLLWLIGLAWAADVKLSYPTMAPIEQYRVASAAEEIALARSAAPTSISGDAEVLTLGEQGYETAVKGKNGFVCMVWRSWTADFDDAEFWNPRLRAPICLNPAAARSVLPAYLERTRWAIGGVSKSHMIDRTKAAVAANNITAPE